MSVTTLGLLDAITSATPKMPVYGGHSETVTIDGLDAARGQESGSRNP